MKRSAIIVSVAVLLMSTASFAEKIEHNAFKLDNALIKQRAGNFTKKKVEPGAAKVLKRKATKKKRKRRAKRKVLRKKVKRRAKKVVVKKAAVKKVVAKKVPQAHDNWWKSTGTPAIEAFRDCISSHAEELAKTGKPISSTDFIKQYMNPSCGTQRDRMVKVLKKGLGEDEYKKVSDRLIDDVFVPAIVAAVTPDEDKTAEPSDVSAKAVTPDAADTKRDVETASRPVAGGAVNIGRNVEAENRMRTAKTAMFNCFRQKADYLSAHNIKTPADKVASAVVSTCKNEADVFFASLHKLFRASPSEQETRKFEAINHTYKPAIEKRIRIKRRSAGVSVPPKGRVATGAN